MDTNIAGSGVLMNSLTSVKIFEEEVDVEVKDKT